MRRGVFKQGVVFVPDEYAQEIMRLPKAALADMVWDLASRGTCDDFGIISEVRETAATIKRYRAHEQQKMKAARAAIAKATGAKS